MIEVMLRMLQRSYQTSQSYRLIICILNAMLSKSLSIIDLFVELKGLQLLEEIAAGSSD